MRTATSAVFSLALAALCGAAAATPAHAEVPPAAPVVAATEPPAAAAAAVDRLGVVVGGSQLQWQDRAFIALRYDGFVPAAALAYEHVGARSRHEARLAFAGGDLANRFEMPALAIVLGAAYAYERDVASLAGGDLRLAVGGVASGGPSLHQYRWEDSDHVYWMTAYTVGPRLFGAWRMGASAALEGTLELPVAGVSSRPVAPRYYNNDKPDFGSLMARAHQDLRFAWLGNYLAPRFSFGVRYAVSEHFVQRLAYELRYERFGSDPVAQQLSHALSMALLYQF